MASILPPVPWDRPQTSFEWVDWYTKLRDVIDNSALDHNSLNSLQGGTTGEYYHLTSAQHTALLSGIQWKDEGSNLGTSGTVTSVDFTGAGVTASRAANAVTVNITGGSGSFSDYLSYTFFGGL